MSAVSMYKISRTGAGITTFGVGVHPDALLELVRVAHPVQQVPLHGEDLTWFRSWDRTCVCRGMRKKAEI